MMFSEEKWQLWSNESLSPGEYTSECDAAGFASGIYFYSISAAGYTVLMKLLLIR